MARHKWGGRRSKESQMRGLETRYKNGSLKRETLIAAYRREAERLEALIATSLLTQPTQQGWVRAWRRKADVLEKENGPQ